MSGRARPAGGLRAEGCLAVLLGASAWGEAAGYRPAPEFAESARGLRAYVGSPLGLGVAGARFLDLFDSVESAEGQLRRVRAFVSGHVKAGGVTDLFVFAVSHGEGTRQNRRDLHLIVHATETGFVDGTGLSIRQLAASLIRTGSGLRRYFVLDCCFAGAALAHFQSGAEAVGSIVADDIRRTAREVADPAERLAAVEAGVGPGDGPGGALPREGTVLFCSSRADDVSLARGSDGRTLFTGSVLGVLCSGAAADGPVISFARLRDRAWAAMVAEAGEGAPYPQLYAPVQQGGDLSVVPLLPVLVGGGESGARPRGRRVAWWRGWRARSVVLAAVGLVVVGGTVLWPLVRPLVSPAPVASVPGQAGGGQAGSPALPVPIGAGVWIANSAGELRAWGGERHLQQHTIDCQTVTFATYPDALSLRFGDPAQAARPCVLRGGESTEIAFRDGVRAFDLTYQQGVDYATVRVTLKDGRRFVRKSGDFFPETNYFGVLSETDIATVEIVEEGMGNADVRAVTFYATVRHRRVLQ